MDGMDFIKDRLSVIDKYVPRGSVVMFVDYPIHLNVGDILIMKGTEQFFRSRNYMVAHRYSMFGFPDSPKQFPPLSKNTVIVMQGGGNFGDVYLRHQSLRNRVIEHYRDNRIVVFPQTMFFRDQAEMKRTAAIFSQHPDLHFMARDRKTYETFRRRFSNNVEMCPDMAHALWRQLPQARHSGKTLYMLRRDEESAALPPGMRETDGVDWDDLCRPADRFAARLAVHSDQINAKAGAKVIPVDAAWSRYTDALFARIVRHFLRHDTIVTSRMHGHILGCLLGMKTTLLDNSYGKNSTYFQAWTSIVENCDLVAEPALPATAAM